MIVELDLWVYFLVLLVGGEIERVCVYLGIMVFGDDRWVLVGLGFFWLVGVCCGS